THLHHLSLHDALPIFRLKTGRNDNAAPGRSRTRRPSFSRSLDGEGLAAPAGGAGVRVVDHEARALEALLVIHFGAGEILETHRRSEEHTSELQSRENL